MAIIAAASKAELSEVQRAHAVVHHTTTVVGSQESVGLRRGKVTHGTHTLALHREARGARARSATLHSGQLLGLKSSRLLWGQYLTQLIGHEDISIAHLRHARGHGPVVRRPGTAELAHIIQLDAIVNSGQGSQFHSSGVGYHISLVVRLLEVGDHGSAQLRGPASTWGVRGRKKWHVGRVGLERVQCSGLHIVAIVLEREARRAETGRWRWLRELAHWRLLVLLLARRLGAIRALVPG